MLTCMLRQDPQGGLVYQLAGEVSMGPQELICVSPLGCTSPMWPAGRLVMGLAVAAHCAALRMVPAAG